MQLVKLQEMLKTSREPSAPPRGHLENRGSWQCPKPGLELSADALDCSTLTSASPFPQSIKTLCCHFGETVQCLHSLTWRPTVTAHAIRK